MCVSARQACNVPARILGTVPGLAAAISFCRRSALNMKSGVSSLGAKVELETGIGLPRRRESRNEEQTGGAIRISSGKRRGDQATIGNTADGRPGQADGVEHLTNLIHVAPEPLLFVEGSTARRLVGQRERNQAAVLRERVDRGQTSTPSAPVLQGSPQSVCRCLRSMMFNGTSVPVPKAESPKPSIRHPVVLVSKGACRSSACAECDPVFFVRQAGSGMRRVPDPTGPVR